MNSMPLACDMTVFTPAEREEHIQNTSLLYKTVQNVSDVPNGYEFTFPYGAELTKLAEFISNERRCCAFLEFNVKVLPQPEPIILTLSGPEGTQEFLREEFSEAFA